MGALGAELGKNMEKGDVYILFISQECLWPVEQMILIREGHRHDEKDNIPALGIL